MLALGPVPGVMRASPVAGTSPAPTSSTAARSRALRQGCCSVLVPRALALVVVAWLLPAFGTSATSASDIVLRRPASNIKGTETEGFPPLLRYRPDASTKTSLPAQQHESHRGWTNGIRLAKPPTNRRPNEGGSHGHGPRPPTRDGTPSTPSPYSTLALTMP